MGWDGMGWDGMGWDGMGWDGMITGSHIENYLCYFKRERKVLLSHEGLYLFLVCRQA
jgi:hypothetical protein